MVFLGFCFLSDLWLVWPVAEQKVSSRTGAGLLVYRVSSGQAGRLCLSWGLVYGAEEGRGGGWCQRVCQKSGEDPWVGGLSGILAAKILKFHEAVNTRVSSLLGYPRTMTAYSLNWNNQTFLK